MSALEKIFGPNWRTSAWGALALISGAISINPSLVSFLPENIKSYVIGFASLISFISGGAFVYNANDKQVTGGNVASTEEAEKRLDEAMEEEKEEAEKPTEPKLSKITKMENVARSIEEYKKKTGKGK